MPLPHDPDARRYYRAAAKRLEDARLILDRLERTTAAVYLAGYCVECMLKALILSETAAADRPQTLTRFLGQRAHDFAVLRGWYHQAGGAKFPAPVAEALSFVGDWNTSLRYSPGDEPVEYAEEFVASVERFWEWADRRLS